MRGTLVEGLTDGDIWRLDTFEGSEYERAKVEAHVLQQLESGHEHVSDHLSQHHRDNAEVEVVEAETYIWIAGTHRLESEPWDFSEFVRDKMKRWIGGDAAEMDSGFRGVHSVRLDRIKR